ncbi:MAG TPA: hypothetical protein DEH78_17110, partial [Solibacterales bacterium]|nr:hypothetical protein [Bryobacterales bacterium]
RVIADFGRGGVLVGADAVAAGMADALGSYEGVLAGLTAPARPSLFVVPPIAAMAAQTEEPPMPPEEQTTQAAETAELAALRQQLAAEREKRISAEASAFAEARIAEHKLMPGERTALVELYQAIARDDADHPRVAGPRVDLLATAFRARPAHALTTEVVPVGELAAATVVANQVTTPPAGPEAEQAKLAEEATAHAKSYAERRNGRK